jgi:hypothetical protein
MDAKPSSSTQLAAASSSTQPAEASSSTQLADFAIVREQLLSGPSTYEEQAIRLLNRRNGLGLREEQWVAMLEGQPQGLLDAIAQRDGQQGKLSNAKRHIVIKHKVMLVLMF